MSTQQNDIPTCDLRKPCGWCKRPFGRKTKMNRGKLILISVKQFDKQECCSHSCATKLATSKRHKEQEQISIKHQVENFFLYGRPMA